MTNKGSSVLSLNTGFKDLHPSVYEEEGTYSNGGGGLVGGGGNQRVFVEVDRLAPASWGKKRLILLGITGSTLGDARQLPIPISPH